jgi:hypothetical protein
MQRRKIAKCKEKRRILANTSWYQIPTLISSQLRLETEATNEKYYKGTASSTVYRCIDGM